MKQSIRSRLKNRIGYEFNLIKAKIINYTLLFLSKYPKVLGSHESITYIIENKLSVSRFGCGELAIIKGEDWGFQKFNEKLRKRLIDILKSDESNIAICIPDVFEDRSRLAPEANKFWKWQVVHFLHLWNRYTVTNKVYFDSLFTRFYIDLKDKYSFPHQSILLLRRIWDGQDLLLIEGNGSRMGFRNDLYRNSKSICRILCPSENAFSSYERILETSIRHSEGRLILIALGMTATVLAFDLSKVGIRAIDIGHIDLEYEWYKMKTDHKVPVNYRYSNEVDSRKPAEIVDLEFESQIVDIIQ